MPRLRLVTVLAAGVLLVAGCGGDESLPADDHGHGRDFAFGEPAPAANADRVVTIITNDALRFEPDAFDVALGETVTFRVTNAGVAVHDFTLGDSATQEEHAAIMAGMGSDVSAMPDEPNAFVLEVGETQELTWKFTVPGEVLIGCHQPGHYAAGMVASITVGG